MAGKPIRQLRRQGVDIPRLTKDGDKDPISSKALADLLKDVARARESKPVPTGSDEELLAKVRDQLLDMMLNGGGMDLGGRVSAAKALAAMLTPATAPVVVQQNVTQAPAAPQVADDEVRAIIARHRRDPQDDGKGSVQ